MDLPDVTFVGPLLGAWFLFLLPGGPQQLKRLLGWPCRCSRARTEASDSGGARVSPRKGRGCALSGVLAERGGVLSVQAEGELRPCNVSPTPGL